MPVDPAAFCILKQHWADRRAGPAGEKNASSTAINTGTAPRLTSWTDRGQSARLPVGQRGARTGTLALTGGPSGPPQGRGRGRWLHDARRPSRTVGHVSDY